MKGNNYRRITIKGRIKKLLKRIEVWENNFKNLKYKKYVEKEKLKLKRLNKQELSNIKSKLYNIR